MPERHLCKWALAVNPIRRADYIILPRKFRNTISVPATTSTTIRVENRISRRSSHADRCSMIGRGRPAPRRSSHQPARVAAPKAASPTRVASRSTIDRWPSRGFAHSGGRMACTAQGFTRAEAAAVDVTARDGELRASFERCPTDPGRFLFMGPAFHCASGRRPLQTSRLAK